MASASNIGFVTSFVAGAISFLSPCVLPLVPGYLSYMAGQSVAGAVGNNARWRALGLSIFFVFGFSTVFVLLGLGASALSLALNAYRWEVNLISGLLVIAFGLFTADLVRFPWLERELRWRSSSTASNPTSAFVLGMAFGFGWTPCIGPLLGAVLAVSTSSQSVNGVVLLTAYSLGLGIPFILAALFADNIGRKLRNFRKVGRILQLIAGAIMIVMGVAMITGHLTLFAIFMLETFPALGNFG